MLVDNFDRYNGNVLSTHMFRSRRRTMGDDERAKRQKTLATKLAKLKAPPLPPNTKYDLRACLHDMLTNTKAGPDRWKPGTQLGRKDDPALVAATNEMHVHNANLFVETDQVEQIEKYLTEKLSKHTYTWSFTVQKWNCVVLASNILRQWDFENNTFSLADKDLSALKAGFKGGSYIDCAMWHEHVAKGGLPDSGFLVAKQCSAVLQFNKKGSESDHFAQLMKWLPFQSVYNDIITRFRKDTLSDETPIDQKFVLEYVHVIVFENKSVLFTHHKDSVANSQDSTVMTVICQLTGDTTSMQVLGAPEEAMYRGFGACHAFPADAYHRSGTATTATMKLVLGFKLRKIPPKPDMALKAHVDLEPDDDGEPSGAASSSTVLEVKVNPEQQEQPAVPAEDEAEDKEDAKSGVKAEANSEPDAHTVPGGPSGAAGSSTVPDYKPDYKEQQEQHFAAEAEDAADDDNARCTCHELTYEEEI